MVLLRVLRNEKPPSDAASVAANTNSSGVLDYTKESIRKERLGSTPKSAKKHT